MHSGQPFSAAQNTAVFPRLMPRVRLHSSVHKKHSLVAKVDVDAADQQLDQGSFPCGCCVVNGMGAVTASVYVKQNHMHVESVCQ